MIFWVPNFVFCSWVYIVNPGLEGLSLRVKFFLHSRSEWEIPEEEVLPTGLKALSIPPHRTSVFVWILMCIRFGSSRTTKILWTPCSLREAITPIDPVVYLEWDRLFLPPDHESHLMCSALPLLAIEMQKDYTSETWKANEIIFLTRSSVMSLNHLVRMNARTRLCFALSALSVLRKKKLSQSVFYKEIIESVLEKFFL